MKYILLLGAFQAFIALVLFFSARNKKPSDNLLNGMLVCLTAHLSIKFVIYALLNNETLKMSFNTFIDLAYGPLLWMYAKKITNDKFQPKRYWYHLALPFVAAIAYTVISIEMLVSAGRSTALITLYNDCTKYLIILSFFVYPLLSYRLALKLPAFWLSEKKLIQTVSSLFCFISLLSVVALVLDSMRLFPSGYFIMPLRTVAYSFLLITSGLIIRYRMATQYLLKNVPDEIVPNIAPIDIAEALPIYFEENLPAATVITAAEELNLDEINASQPPARKPLLAQETQQEIAAKLMRLITAKKVFTDPELTLEKLSALANIPRNHISETLNQHIGKSFYQFINEFRIEEVIKILDRCKKQNLTPSILPIAFEAGFHSKTSFNQYFKKHTGLTPSEYLKKGKTQFLTSPAALHFSATQMAH
jgi:AraC-like DNA-binding protein